MSIRQNISWHLSIPTLPNQSYYLQSFYGTETLSAPFEYQLYFYIKHKPYDAQQLLGQAASWSITIAPYKPPRYFHGVIAEVCYLGFDAIGRFFYQIKVVPWLQLLMAQQAHRIFNHKTAVHIVELLFQEYHFYHYDLSKVQYGNTRYPMRAQYQQTTIDFIHELLIQEGINYYFRHDNDCHQMLFTDTHHGFQRYGKPVYYMPYSIYGEPYLNDWQHSYQLCVNQVTLKDYCFQSPQYPLQAIVSAKNKDEGVVEYEHYPGYFATYAAAEYKTHYEFERQCMEHEWIKSASCCSDFNAGIYFDLQHATDAAASNRYLITTIQHEFDANTANYQNQLWCIPYKTRVRPKRRDNVPIYSGMQIATASIVHTDCYAHIPFQFCWCRHNQWARTVTLWAEKEAGMMLLPGSWQSLLVQFLQGDINRPIINGTMQQYVVNKAQLVIKLRGGNTIGFNNKQGKEALWLTAAESLIFRSKGSQYVTCNGNQHITLRAGDDVIQLQQGALQLQAQKAIEYRVGDSFIRLTKNSVSIVASNIKIN